MKRDKPCWRRRKHREREREREQALCTRIDYLLKHGLSAKAAFLILQTYSKSCTNHLQRANFENGPRVAQLEDILQDALARLANVTGLPSAQLHPSKKLLASLRTKDGGLAYGGLPMRSSTAFIGSWFPLHEARC